MADDKIYATKIKTAECEMPQTADEIQAERTKRGIDMHETMQRVGTLLTALVILSAGAFIMHGIYPVLHPVSFVKAKAYFAKAGKPFEGEVMEESNRICQDSAETPLACYSLSRYSEPPTISQAH